MTLYPHRYVLRYVDVDESIDFGPTTLANGTLPMRRSVHQDAIKSRAAHNVGRVSCVPGVDKLMGTRLAGLVDKHRTVTVETDNRVVADSERI